MHDFKLLAVTILCGLIIHVKSLHVKSSSKFPFLLNETFHFKIALKTDQNISSIPLGDSMVIQIVDETGLIKERAIFNHGLSDKFDYEFHGNFMKIVKWELISESSDIEISVKFQSKSNLYIVEIYYISSKSKQIYQKMLKDLNLAKRIYRNVISLLNPSKLDLHFNPNNENNFSWDLGDIITVTCRAYDGIPIKIPLFKNFQSLAIVDSKFSSDKNERIIRFSIRKSDHGKSIQCVVGDISKTQIIKVKHRPSKIYIEPKINNGIHPSTPMDCYVKDGYPTPNIKWIYISGPPDPLKFYSITQNGTRLLINKNSPNTSKWKFECRISQKLGSFVTIMKRDVSFIFQRKKEFCNIDCINTKFLDLKQFTENIQKYLRKIEDDQTKIDQKTTENFRIELKTKLFNSFNILNNKLENFKRENEEENQNQVSKINILTERLSKIDHKFNDTFIDKVQINLINNQISEIRQKINERVTEPKNTFKDIENFVTKFIRSLHIEKQKQIEQLQNQLKVEIDKNSAKIKHLTDKLNEIGNGTIGYRKRKMWRFRKRLRENKKCDNFENDGSDDND